MIIDRKCQDCRKGLVCSWSKVIDKFDDEVAKIPIGTIMEFQDCPEFEEVEEQ